ncbi:MAG TPA: type II secretion system protein GspL [Dokdonella sp.]|jgi:general secretion pathway protein L|nr:type II secretion system protein GspL [Dokdonella sp.]
MPDRLIIRLDAQGGLHWLRQSEDGRALSSSQPGAPPAQALAAAGEVLVLVPAADVLLLETQVTARNHSQLQKAVPFAVEDQLLGAVEEQHFAIQAGPGGRVGVAVVAKSRVREWLGKLAASGIRPDRMLPDSLAMPIAPETGSLMVEQGRALARLEPWSAMACSLAQFPHWLAQARAAGVGRALEVHDFGTDPLPALSGPILATHRRQDALAFLANNLRGNGINLLSGEFAASHRSGRAVRWWRRAAVLAAAMILLVLLHHGLEIRSLQKQVDQADANMRERLGRTFPDLGAAERVRAPQDVMRQRLDGLRGGGEDSGFLAMLGTIAPVIGRTTRSQLRGLEYRNDTLELGLRSPDVATLDGLREQFSAIPGFNAEVTASIPVENAVDGRIRISKEAK